MHPGLRKRFSKEEAASLNAASLILATATLWKVEVTVSNI